MRKNTITLGVAGALEFSAVPVTQAEEVRADAPATSSAGDLIPGANTGISIGVVAVSALGGVAVQQGLIQLPAIPRLPQPNRAGSCA